MNDLHCLELFTDKLENAESRNLEKNPTESAFRRCSTKYVYLEIMRNTLETLVSGPLLMKLYATGMQLY